jgi:hypothetical protein
VGADNYPLDDMPGWDYNSIGYHADDGKLFCESGAGTEFGPTCTNGDRMGCGIDFRDEDDSSDQVKVFFTKNSQQIGDAIRIKIPAGGLYSLIGMCSEGEKVQYTGHWHYLPPTPTGTKIPLSPIHVVVSCDFGGGGDSGYKLRIRLYRSCYIDPLKCGTCMGAYPGVGACPGLYGYGN